DGSQGQGLERTIAHDSAGQEKEQPDKAGVMWLEKQGNGEEENAGEFIAPFEETPCANGTKTDGDAGDITNFEQEFRVGEKKAEQAAGEQGCRSAAEIEHEKGSQPEERGGEDNPKVLRNGPGKNGERNSHKQGGWEIHVQSDRVPAFFGGGGIGQELATFGIKLLKDSNRIVGINMAQGAVGTVVNSAEVDHQHSTGSTLPHLVSQGD